MKGIILHGGHGTRLRPLTFARPKQLLPIANKPMSQFGLELLKSAGINDVAIIIGGENSFKVKQYYGNGEKFGINISYIYQDEPKGISHAINLCKDFVKNEKFIVFLGDNVLIKNISESIKNFDSSGDDAKMFLCEVDNPTQFGIADIEGNRVKKIMEKPKNPPTNLAVIGVYLLTEKIFDVIKRLKPSWRNELEITDALQMLLEEGNKISFEIITNYWKDTGTIDDIIDANKTILENLKLKSNDVDEKNEVEMIDKTCKLENDLKVIEPVLIGENCEIGKNVSLGPNVSIGSNCNIQNCSIENSIIMNDCKISGPIEISKSIIPYNSNIVKKMKSSFLICENSKIEL